MNHPYRDESSGSYHIISKTGEPLRSTCPKIEENIRILGTLKDASPESLGDISDLEI